MLNLGTALILPTPLIRLLQSRSNFNHGIGKPSIAHQNGYPIYQIVTSLTLRCRIARSGDCIANEQFRGKIEIETSMAAKMADLGGKGMLIENNAAVALTTSFLFALVYFCGFGYLYFYFDFFGINIVEINPTIQFVISHSFTSLYLLISNNVWVTLFLLICISLILKEFFHIERKMKLPMVIIVYLISIIIIYPISEYTGKIKAISDMNNLRISFVELKNNNKLDDLKHINIHRLKTIIVSNTYIYGLQFTGNGDSFFTIRIPINSADAISTYIEASQ